MRFPNRPPPHRPRTSPLLIMLLTCTGVWSQEGAPPPVETATVIEAAVNSGYRVVGTVVPLRTATIGSAVAGRVKAFNVRQGQAVQAGQALAQLRTESLEIELKAARAQLELYKQQLLELQNGARIEEIAEATANAEGAKAAMENAASQLRRLETLAASRAATQADLEDARERARYTQFTFAAADAMRQRIEAGPRAEQKAQASAQVELQQHNVELIEDRLAKHTLVAPFDGFVSEEYTELGSWIASGDPVAQVIQLDKVEIQASVTADYATKLRLGEAIRVEFPELPDQLFTGTVERIVPVAESRSRTFPVIIRLSNRLRQGAPMLMAGMLARVDLPAGQRKTMPLVPKDALVLNEAERAVFVFEADTSGNAARGSVRRVPVELGVAVGGLIQVIGDLQAGQQVVVVGNERLQPQAEVTVVKTTHSEMPAG